jgi:iodotyrosine deiodinase
MMDEKPMVPLRFERQTETEMRSTVQQWYARLIERRSVRQFSTDPVPRDIIETCIQSAATAPSGANLQPWHFAAVQDPAMKTRIRDAAELEERTFYESRAPEEWKTVLKPFGTDASKPYLEKAPWLIAIFAVNSFENEAGQKQQTYYPKESVGIATGILISALHHAGLATLAHTPSPMNFLNDLLDRPKSEKPFLLLVVGYPDADAMVPALSKKTLPEFATFF